MYYFSYSWFQNTFSDTLPPQGEQEKKNQKKLMGTGCGVFVVFFFFSLQCTYKHHLLQNLLFLKSDFCLRMFIWMHTDTTGSSKHFCQLTHSTKCEHLILKLLQSHYLKEMRQDFLPDPSVLWVKILTIIIKNSRKVWQHCSKSSSSPLTNRTRRNWSTPDPL